MSTSNEIRQQFINFFTQKAGHTEVPSSPVVPHDDPTLLFTNAGMNQFKDVFLGVGKREYTRAVDTQKCIRAGGKHNDLDDVGKDTYHHTFFEMLGNWSFGDYFKAEAIQWAWELLVDQWGLDPERLHATYFKGDKAEGLEPDDEARDMWLKYLPAERVHPGNKKDNFWEMGDTGPCGPCSELHYDRTEDKNGGALVNADDARVIEIWNLVFIQFNRSGDGTLTSLPAKHVDTGMGFERIVAVLQGKTSNYDTDAFTPIFDAIKKVTGVRAYTGKLEDSIDVAYRVIADHIRTLTFAMSDGAMPGNEGRSYVLRRILRRAVRYGRQTLGVTEPFFYKLVDTVVELMGDVFPELKTNPQQIVEVLREEEELFGKTLGQGIRLFDALCETAKEARFGGQWEGKKFPENSIPLDANTGGLQESEMELLRKNTIPGQAAFKLYATFGFPLDLTQLMAQERGMTVDVDGYDKAYQTHQQASKGVSGGADARQSLIEIVQQAGDGELPATEFTGYETTVTEGSQLSAVYVLHGGSYQKDANLQVGQKAALVVDRSPFYAEAGGQVGDTGTIHSRQGAVFTVEDTIKVGDVYFHLGELESGNMHGDEKAFDAEDTLILEVNAERRSTIVAHHTATHVLNHKLRDVLGDHVQQRGSLVDEEKTRFDFSHNHALKLEEIEAVELKMQADIQADLLVYADFAAQEEALKIQGLRAVFGEKYPPRVRVVSIGVKPAELLEGPVNDAWENYSIEFCGGVHLPSTGKIGAFTLVAEEAVAKGIRRLVGVSGQLAEKAIRNGTMLTETLDALQQANTEAMADGLKELADTINEQVLPLTVKAKLRQGMTELQKKLKLQQKKQAKESAGQIVEQARDIAQNAEGLVIVAQLESDGTGLRTAMDVIKKTRPDAAMMLGGSMDGKVSLLAAVPKELIGKGLKAGDWVKQIAPLVGGGGGGRPDMAQAGGKDPEKLGEALEVAKVYAAELIK